jgi:hypothetical protein
MGTNMKKLLLILFILFSFASSAQVTVVAHNTRGGANGATTTSTNTTGASFIAIQISEYDGVTFGTLTDNKSNTWTQLRVDKVSATVANYTYYCSPCTVGTGHTFTYTKTGSFSVINVIAVGNTVTSSPIDQQSGTFNAAATSIQPGSITPTQNGEIIIATIATSNTGGAVAINSGFVITDGIAFNAGVNQGATMAYLIQGAGTAVNPTFSWNSSAPVAVTQFSVKASGSNGGGFFILTQ